MEPDLLDILNDASTATEKISNRLKSPDLSIGDLDFLIFALESIASNVKAVRNIQEIRNI